MGNMTLTRKRGVLDSSRVLFLPVRDIRPNPNQPRTTFSLKGLEELSASIREHGILQPLTVRRAEDKGYELISGERRLRAAKISSSGWTTWSPPCWPSLKTSSAGTWIS